MKLNPIVLSSARSIGKYSQSKMIDGLEFDISNDNDIMHFTLKNFNESTNNIAELKFDKKLFQQNDSDLLYSYLVGFFDCTYLLLDEHCEGFLDDYLNEMFIKKYPTTVTNLKPKNIKKFDSFEKSINELDEVIKRIGKPLIEARQNQK